MAAAGTTDPDVQLSDRGRLVFEWLADGDETLCAGVVELLDTAVRQRGQTRK